MEILIYLIPVTLFLGLVGLFSFMWCVKNKQYEDIKGAANRILFEEENEEENEDKD
ncbi:cbb3-type cytochrome oxidase assembly protein CcoS [Rickettsiales bacterium]|nr:cbb3-type cytochrome oxidase assembly protein CcoS [Rickettsiales bacterium]